jgi:hypothetical protein
MTKEELMLEIKRQELYLEELMLSKQKSPTSSPEYSALEIDIIVEGRILAGMAERYWKWEETVNE